MEDIGSEGVKRQRLDSAGNASIQRMQQQHYNQHTAPPTPQQQLQLHNTNFGPPNSAGPSHYAQVPPSPYDARNLAEQQQQQPPPNAPPQQQHHHHSQPPPQQQQQQYGQPASGYSTPNRDVRAHYPEQQGVPHHLRRDGGAMPGLAHAPDEGPQPQNIPQHPQGPAPTMRPVNTEFGGPEYGQPYPPNPSAHPADMPAVDAAPGGPYMNQDPQQQNGNYHAMPMSQPPPNGPHHPHSMTTAAPPPGHLQHAQYGPGPGMDFTTPTTPVYAFPSQQQGGPKKNSRAQQACENCRARKAKCDEGKPACGHCRENNTECKYKDMPPAKSERAQKEMMDKFESIKDDSLATQHKVDALIAQNAEILALLAELRGGNLQSPSQARPASHNFVPSTPMEGSATKRPRTSANDHSRWVASDVQVAATEGEPGGPVTLSHNTGAHRLLRWNSIVEMLSGVLPDQNYVMKLEEHKGVLHYYGKGQSQDRMEGFVPPAPGSPATPSAAPDDVQASQEIWGTDLGRPYLAEGKFFGCKDDSLGGLTLDGSLNLEWNVMNQLMGKYIEHFHLLHPFLNTAHLRQMVQRVHSQANPGASNAQSPFLKNVMRDNPPTGPQVSKRKYSVDLGDPGTPGAGGRNAGRAQEQPLERRISTAIVLLVLALGKICEYTAPLPGPVPDNGIPVGTPANKMMPAPSLPIKAESPANIESPMRDAGSSIPSPMSISDRGAPTSSSTSVTAQSGNTPQELQSRPMRPGDRNVDVVPGLAYYVRAVEILGVLNGGNEVAHAQAFLLAALYCSQNACVLESWAWLQNACRVARFHVREQYLETETRRNPDGANIIRFVFYTALQLESDIIAELDVQSSGIAQLHSDRVSAEKEIGFPKGVSDKNNQIKMKHKSMNQIEMFYSYQLSMRTLLNDIQTYLYPTNQNAIIDMRAQEHFEERIKLWRATLTPTMIWTDDDEPSKDYNEARLRAKYYGARYITHRPSLYYALHDMTAADWPAGMWSTNGGPETDINESFADDPSDIGFNLDDKQERILRSCKMCVKSAIHSTIAFDGIVFDRTGRFIKQRLIVTNIFGTAHAQFGNMLVLSAVYSSYMSSLVDRTKLMSLLRRTIKFLRSHQTISTTLGKDASILEHVFNRIQNENRDKTGGTQVLTNGQPPNNPNSWSAMSTPTQAQATPGGNLTSSFNSVQ